MSMYADYLRERTNDEIIEKDTGFATYRIIPDSKSVYIIDIFVLPAHRKSKVGSAIADEIVSIAKSKGCTKLLGSVVPSSKGSTASIDTLRGYGMTLASSGVDFIFFEKEI